MNADLLRTYNPHPLRKARLGAAYDGGYVVCHLEGKYDVMISSGVQKGNLFERDMALLHPDSALFMFDKSPRISAAIEQQNVRLIKEDLCNGKNSTTDIASFLLGDNMFLKIDCNGLEYQTLAKLIKTNSLSKFKQMVITFHTPPHIASHPEKFPSHTQDINHEKWERILKWINSSHALVHVSGHNQHNCHLQWGVRIPNVLTCTYVRTDALNKMVVNSEMFPTAYDTPNAMILPGADGRYYLANNMLMPYNPFVKIENPDRERAGVGRGFVIILTCKKYAHRVRPEYTSNLTVPFRYFIGDPDLEEPCDDPDTNTVYLPCKDDYVSLPQKTTNAIAWVYNTYPDVTHVLKTDDDIIMDAEIVNNLMTRNVPAFLDYGGRMVNHKGGTSTYHFSSVEEGQEKKAVHLPPCAYCSGGGYILSRKAMKVVVDLLPFIKERYDYVYEDYVVGKIMADNGIPQTIIPIHYALWWDEMYDRDIKDWHFLFF